MSRTYRDHSSRVCTSVPLALPDATDGDDHLPLVDVALGPVERIGDPERQGTAWACRGALVVLDVAGIGRASIDDGRHVVVDNRNGARDDELAQVIANTVLTTASVLRGTTVIHATVVRLGDRTVAFSAPARTGKSTLAVALEQRGARVHADDGCHIDDADRGRVTTRGWAPLRLLDDSSAALGTDLSAATVMPHAPWKRVYSPAERDAPGSYRLDALVLLERGAVEHAQLAPMGGAAAVPEVATTLYRRRLVASIDGGEAVFTRAAAVTAAVDIARLTVPDDLDAIDRTADEVLALLWP